MTGAVPILRSSFASRTPDEAWDALSQMYTKARPSSTASPDVSIRFDGAATPDIAVDRGWLATASGAFDDSPGQLNFITVEHGRINLDFGRAGFISNATGDSYLFPQDRAGDLRWEGFGALTLRLSPHLVSRTAAELTGIPAQDLRFTSSRPSSPGQARLWRRTIRFLWQELNTTDHDITPLVHRELVDLAATTAVTVFPNTAMTHGHVPGPGDVRPAALRRAIAYVDAHAGQPITVSDIADAAGTTPQALRAAFRRHLGTTPRAYLRRVRLEHARHDLRTTDPHRPVDVRRIALR